MKLMKLSPWFAFLAIANLAVQPLITANPAQASVYSDFSTRTKLLIAQDNNTQPTSGGMYISLRYKQVWFGTIDVKRMSQMRLTTIFKGSFSESQEQGSAQCSGNLTLVRSKGTAVGIPVLQATFQVTGGANCPFVGRTDVLTLPEALPRPNFRGDFMDADTSIGAASMQETWRSWRVVSSDGELNCRATPNGAIRKVYRTNDVIDVSNTDDFNPHHHGSSIKLFNDQPWLHTTDGCFVRAHTRYIQPRSLPF